MTEQTTTRRAPGRPKKNPDAAKPAAKKSVIQRKEVVKRHSEFETMGRAGIVTMLPQNGITIYDEDNDTVREIRYCPNEPSIFTDNQGDKAKKEAVIFREGKLFVPKEKPNLRLFLDKHPGNEANGGNLFREVNKQKEAEQELKREFLQYDAISMVREKPIEELLPVALYFGYNINAPTTDIRYNLLQKAKRNPQEFIESFDNPQVHARSIVKQAQDYHFILVKPDGVYWLDSKQLIVSVPAGLDPLDVMTRFCLTEKGAAVLSNLEDKLAKLA